MWKKPEIQEVVINESMFETMDDNSLNQIDGGKDFGWYGGCAGVGSACGWNYGGLAIGLCVGLGGTYVTKYTYKS
ncbi:MAG: bacteriocin [Eubacterium sp.]|nr:bacteriocin [Eubacterium sp.]